jgi:uncharacterized protein (DUF58 family)
MKSFYVLTAPAATDPDRDTIFIRDGFSWFAFLFPLPWLLFRRLWIAAIIAVVLYLVSILIAEQYGLDALPVAFSFLLSLWVALEGGEARVRRHERLGWQVDRVLVAHNVADAEEIYFTEKVAQARRQPTEPPPVLSAAKPAAQSNIVALGLIGPQGGR